MSTASGKEGKKWFKLTAGQPYTKMLLSIIETGSAVRVTGDCASLIPKPPNRTTWEPKLYKMIGTSRFKFIIEYDSQKFVELRVKQKKGNKFEVVKVTVDCKYPDEFAGGGSGFDGAGLGGHSGTRDGILKSLSAFSGSAAVKAGKVKYKPKKVVRQPKKLESGHLLYSAMGTEEIKTREYDPTASNVYHDSSKDKNFLTPEMYEQLKPHFILAARSYGEGGDDLVPSSKILEVFESSKFPITKMQRTRLSEFARFDDDSNIEFEQMMQILNRTFQEQDKGTFHMTVKELMDLFSQADEDFSGMLEAKEISVILNQVNMVTDAGEIKEYMDKMDKDSDGKLDFEEFIELCQQLYADRGGAVVANRAGPQQFNQTRNIITETRDRVERHHLMIEHLLSQIKNLDEQIEIMDTIQAHSAMQAEINKTREEKARLRKLREEMEMQHRGWMRDMKGIHGREKRDVMEKIKYMEGQRDEANKVLDYVKNVYGEDFAEAMKEVDEARGALQALVEFNETTARDAHQESDNYKDMARLSVERIKRYKEGRPGTVFNPKCYDSAAAIVDFLTTKTSAMEKWLIKRTQFTKKDRESYLSRVEDVKKKREEYEVNMQHLAGQTMLVQKKVREVDRKYDQAKLVNIQLRDKLDDPSKRVHDEAKAKKLEEDIATIQTEIETGHKERLEWSKRLYPKNHELHLQRHKIRLLQVELGELMILVEDVKHHDIVEARMNAIKETDDKQRIEERHKHFGSS